MKTQNIKIDPICSLVELETVVEIIKDFNSILEDKEIQLNQILDKYALKSVMKKDIIDFLQGLNDYKSSLWAMKLRVDKYLKLSSDWTEEYGVNCVNDFYLQFKKHWHNLNSQIQKCNSCLNQEFNSENSIN